MGPDVGGDPVCWAHLVCAECGAIPDNPEATVCERCGEPFPMPLAALGWDDDLQAWFAGVGSGPPGGAGLAGRVSRVDRGAVIVFTEDGARAIQTHDPLATGDWVAVAGDTTEGHRITAVAPRRTSMTRADPGGTGEQVLAANIDLVFVVAGLDRPVRPGRLERAFVVGWEAGAEPHLILTKADLSDDPGAALTEAAAMAPGVDVHVTSVVTGVGLDELRELLRPTETRPRTAALLGESGAGKSTLLNALAGRDVLATGDVRAFDAKGRHTTTARHLIPLPGGGVLIDTPGLRQLGLPSGEAGLSAAFTDVENLAAACRFADCAHDTEPGCVVRAAIADGTLPERRLEAYEKLLREMEHAEGLKNEREKRAEARKFGKLYKEVMADKHGRDRGKNR